jgi:hypothetical protein
MARVSVLIVLLGLATLIPLSEQQSSINRNSKEYSRKYTIPHKNLIEKFFFELWEDTGRGVK